MNQRLRSPVFELLLPKSNQIRHTTIPIIQHHQQILLLGLIIINLVYLLPGKVYKGIVLMAVLRYVISYCFHDLNLVDSLLVFVVALECVGNVFDGNVLISEGPDSFEDFAEGAFVDLF